MKKLPRKYLQLLKGRDKGTLAITFIFSLPIFLVVVGLFVQYALLVNARLTVDRAVAAAARTAMTSFPTDPDIDNMDGVAYLQKSVRMALTPISPQAQDGITPEAQAMSQALSDLGAPIVSTYAQRYSFAQAATTVTWTRVDGNNQPINEAQWTPEQFASASGQRVQITVQYNFMMNVPLVKNFMGHTATIAGITGRYVTFSSAYIVQLSPGRETKTGANGWPQQ